VDTWNTPTNAERRTEEPDRDPIAEALSALAPPVLMQAIPEEYFSCPLPLLF